MRNSHKGQPEAEPERKSILPWNKPGINAEAQPRENPNRRRFGVTFRDFGATFKIQSHSSRKKKNAQKT